MRIAIDGMGGDFSPAAVVEGCIEAIKENNNIEILITGIEERINNELKKYNYDTSRIKVINATEIITPNESPVMAVRKKKDSSLIKALQLVKNKEADAIISAGSTGAIMVGGRLTLGKIKGLDRVALAPILPGKNGPFILVDAGANVDCKPKYLLQFALMGKIYFENILNEDNPSIGLINIGAEEEKGNELTKSTFKLLKDTNFNFIGNVEPRDISNGDTKVLVCDGFIGNTVLKMYEGVTVNIFKMLKKEILSGTLTKLGGLLLKPVFKNFKKKFDYSEYGGSPFMGINGICIKAHGSSNAKAFKNAIKQAEKCYEYKIIDKMIEELNKLNAGEKN